MHIALFFLHYWSLITQESYLSLLHIFYHDRAPPPPLSYLLPPVHCWDTALQNYQRYDMPNYNRLCQNNNSQYLMPFYWHNHCPGMLAFHEQVAVLLSLTYSY